MFLLEMLRLSRVFILREHPTAYDFLVVKCERLRTSPLTLLQPPVKNTIVLFQKITIPPPRNVLGNLEVGGGLKIQSQ